MIYKYASVHPAENKELYMYSSYYGVNFINAFKKSRKDALKKCKAKLVKINLNKEIKDQIFNLLEYKNIEEEKIIQLFSNLLKNKFIIYDKNVIKKKSHRTIDDLDHLFNKINNNKLIDKSRLDNVVKKFEIKKSLYNEIKQSFPNNVLSNDIDETYHLLLSFVIIKYFILSNSYKYLSALLKLNDFLIYRLNDLKFINMELLSCSILLELKILSKLEKNIE